MSLNENTSGLQAILELVQALPSDVVRFSPQSLTDGEKAQARTNIGAATIEEVIAALPVYNGETETTQL